jgi:hypothetical protein
MPILTKASVSKGSPSLFSVDKSALVPLISDSFFQDVANWSKIVLFYKSAAGGQKSKVIFDATQSSPSANFLISEKARDSFEIKSIIIYDFDKGYYEIPRSSLSPAEFDVSLGAVGGGGGVAAGPFRYYRFTVTNWYNNQGAGQYTLGRIVELELTLDDVRTSLVGKPMTLLSGTDGGSFAGINDGSLAQASMVTFSDTISQPVQFSVDLGSSKTLNTIHIAAGQDSSPYPSGRPKSFRLDGSDDGSTWSTVKSFHADITAYPASSAGYLDIPVGDIQPLQAQFIAADDIMNVGPTAIGQSFKLDSNSQVSSIHANMLAWDDSSSRVIRCRILAENGTLIGTSEVLDMAPLSDLGVAKWLPFTFTTPVNLNGATTYRFEIYQTAGSGTVTVKGKTGVFAYANGYHYSGTNYGTNNGHDLGFKIFA